MYDSLWSLKKDNFMKTALKFLVFQILNTSIIVSKPPNFKLVSCVLGLVAFVLL